jgi:hypothetical protein
VSGAIRDAVRRGQRADLEGSEERGQWEKKRDGGRGRDRGGKGKWEVGIED